MPGAWTILTLAVHGEADVVLARQRARQVAGLLGFDTLQQTRLATAVSEIARNALRHGGGGRVAYGVDRGEVPPIFFVQISDSGPGLPEEAQRLENTPRLGRSSGLLVAQRLVDRFEVETKPGRGSSILMGKHLPVARRDFSQADLARVTDELARRPPESLLEELQKQHQELLGILADLTARQDELSRLNEELEETNRGVMALYSQVAQELDDTNRGVLALYAELDEGAEQLRRANYVKDQFISYLSHEFRTPLRSAVALSDFLLGSIGGPMGPEQGKQVGFIRSGAVELLALVDDLLDLAKIQAGKLEVQVEEFTAADLFSALRGMLRPLTPSERVALVFEEPVDIPPLCTDERKIAQVLRNLISNALKFTEEGEVRISAHLVEGGDAVTFIVADSGVGIAPEDQERVFEEFTELPNQFKRRTPGTGLGLPLSRKLTRLLGGDIMLESVPRVGSTFTATIPRVLRET